MCVQRNRVQRSGCFGDMAAMDGAPRSASVTARRRSRIRRLPGAGFRALLADSPELARRMMQVLTARIREANARMPGLTTLDARRRLYAGLLRSAGQGRAGGARAACTPRARVVSGAAHPIPAAY
jgi:CRP-like cAMP-binding protein